MMSSPPILSRRENSLNLLTLWSPSHAKEAPRRVMCCQTCRGHQSKAKSEGAEDSLQILQGAPLLRLAGCGQLVFVQPPGNGSKATHNGKNGQGSSFLKCIGHQHHLMLLLPMTQSPHPCNALKALMRRGWLIQGIRS